jgi:LacI family transcriptional regulator
MIDATRRAPNREGAADIGLVIPDITNPFFPALVQAVENAARARGVGVLIADSNNDAELERDAVRMLIDRAVCAILVSPTHATDSVATLVESSQRVPTIQIDRVVDESLPWVRADQAAPITAIVSHLRASGRHHLAFIGQQTTIPTSHEREVAFEQLMAEAFPDQPLRMVKEAMSAEIGRAAAREITGTWPETDAIVCANDLIAVGVLQQLGIQPGRREVAISGFDDSLLARALRLTSVRQPLTEMAEAALAAALDPAGLPARLAVELPSEVMLRFTTA